MTGELLGLIVLGFFLFVFLILFAGIAMDVVDLILNKEAYEKDELEKKAFGKSGSPYAGYFDSQVSTDPCYYEKKLKGLS